MGSFINTLSKCKSWTWRISIRAEIYTIWVHFSWYGLHQWWFTAWKTNWFLCHLCFHTIWQGSMDRSPFKYVIIYYYVNTWRTVHESLPLACCVIMSWAGFWIKLTNAPARVALTLTTYLSVQTLRQAFILSIPKVPYLKLFDVWMIICESMIFSSLMEFTLAQVWKFVGERFSFL